MMAGLIIVAVSIVLAVGKAIIGAGSNQQSQTSGSDLADAVQSTASTLGPRAGSVTAEEARETAQVALETTQQQAAVRASPSPESPEQQGTSSSPDAGRQAGMKTETLNGVSFDFNLPSGWSEQSGDNQIFLRKSGDARICQIATVKPYDVAQLISDASGHEAEVEEQFVGQNMQVGASLGHVQVQGRTLSSSKDDNSYNYVVRLTSTVSLDNGRSASQRIVNAVSAQGNSLVRLQCANAGGSDDMGSEMEGIAATLKIRD
ncbi:hypothetical protein BZM27_25520 [Paraburkholderia steynii]|uniref:Uncharacterized protein n=1 Tax=Paraburkholderia steynii TaxID=1245441 RepID=A0A4R0X8J2_9BURK|nr:hypothetical protein BZM27_25520 [Paraburkholderia steynii]